MNEKGLMTDGFNPEKGVILGKVKSRKSGHSISLTVPANANPKEGIWYTAAYYSDGTLVYRPS